MIFYQGFNASNRNSILRINNGLNNQILFITSITFSGIIIFVFILIDFYIIYL